MGIICTRNDSKLLGLYLLCGLYFVAAPFFIHIFYLYLLKTSAYDIYPLRYNLKAFQRWSFERLFLLGHMNKTTTQRGFPVLEFKDDYDHLCTVQISSLAEKRCIWLGVNDVDPQILASKVQEGGVGWVKYPIHEDVSLNSRMHLDQDQAQELVSVLQKFIDTGEIY